MESSKISVKKLLTIMSAGFALLMSQRPALANGPNLIHTEAVGQITITSFNYYPKDCTPPPAADCPSCCTYYTLTGTTSGRNIPLGPFTASLSATVLLNAASPNGTPDSSPAESCYPELGFETDTFADGSTLVSDFQGLSCCADGVCTGGLPVVNHDSSVITKGTGRLAGASGGTSWSDNFATPSGPLLMHAEGVLQLPDSSNQY